MPTRTLRILREVNNYTQAFVAEEVLGIRQNTYSRLEQNPGKLTAEQALKLSNLYKVSIPNLLSEVSPIIIFENSGKEDQHDETDMKLSSQNLSFGDKTVRKLEEQIDLLTQQNAELQDIKKAVKGLSDCMHAISRQSSVKRVFG